MTLLEKQINWFTEILIKSGKLDGNSEAKVGETRNAIEYGLTTREGVDKVIHQTADSIKTIDNVAAYLYRSFGKLPYKSKSTDIKGEIEEEINDIREHEETMDALNSLAPNVKPTTYYTEPNSPHLLAETTILNCRQYKGEEELYAANTFKAVLQEAMKEKTSVHEICRRKGLVYGWLIW